MTTLRACVLLGTLLACTPPDGVVAPVEAWAPAAADPLPTHRPPDASCPEAAWGPEEGVLEVDTGGCHYLAVEVPLPFVLRPGDALEGDLWHQLLDAPERAEGHAALLVDGEVVWEVTVAIPGLPEAYPIAWTADRRVEAGTPLGFHLHNHGDNSWRLGEVGFVGR